MVLIDIEKAKSTINKNKIKSTNQTLESYFSKMYLTSNENLSGYLEQFNFENTKVLATGSSTDQVFNLINYGASKIDHIDINPFVKHYFALKRAGILQLNYRKYLDFFNLTKNNKRLVLNGKIFRSLEKDLDRESRVFWNNLYDNFDVSTIRDNLFFSEMMSHSNVCANNHYLNKNNYILMRKKIDKCQIKFINSDIRQLSCEKKQYDFILLSNIFDYIYNLIVIERYEMDTVLFAYRTLLMRLSKLLNNQGTMFFHYFWEVNENFVYSMIKENFKNFDGVSTVFMENAHRKKQISLYGIDKIQDAVMVYQKKK